MLPVATFLTALLLGLVFVPMVRWLCHRIGRVSQPRDDRWHRKPTATLGGIGFFAAFLGGLLVNLLLGGGWEGFPWGLVVGAFMAFCLGLYDDFKRMTPPAKLVGQILVATLFVSLGYTTRFFSPRISNEILAQLPNILLTFFWLVGIANAINLLDNMDGLAGGISLITAGFLSYFFWQSGDRHLLSFSLAMVGGLLAFLVYNFPPASIFMGDGGSMFLGFTLAALAVARQPQASNVFAVMGAPTLLFLLPILDTTLVTFTRLLRGQSPAQGGRDHTSHRLIAFGLTERQAVLSLYGLAVASGVMAAALESIQYWFSLVLVPIVVISLALLMAYLGGLKIMPASTPPDRSKVLTRIMLELTFKRRLLEVLLDFGLIGVAYYLAFLTRYGLVMNEARLSLYLHSLPLALGASYIAFYALGVYRGVWRYVDLGDLVRYFQAALGAMILAAALSFVIGSNSLTIWLQPSLPSRSIFALFGLFLFLGLAASRLSFRLLDLFSRQRIRQAKDGVLVYGAGDTAEMAVRWILMNPRLNYRPAGFLDDDPLMSGRLIHGVPVLGGLEQLDEILEQRHIEGVILAGVDRSSAGAQAVLATCQKHGCWVRSLRLEFEPLE